MRRFIQNNVAMEQEDINRVALENISLEEEQVMLDEGNAAAAEAGQDLNEAERIIEVSDALEDLAVVADGIEEATPAETALVEIAGNMAVAGTDVEPEEIVPAMESYRGTKIATEGIRETAKSIWASIQKFLKEVWEKIEKFFYNILGTIPRLRKSLEAIVAKADDLGDKKAEGTIKLSAGLTHIQINYKTATNEAELKKGLASLTKAADYVYGAYVDATVKAGEGIAKIVAEFDPSKAGEVCSKLRAEMKGFQQHKIPGAGMPQTGRFPGFATNIGEALMGNVSLAHKQYVDNKEGESDLGALDRHRQTRTELIPTAEKAPAATGKEAEITPISAAGIKALAKDIDGLLDKLEDFKRGAKANALKTAKKKLEDASSKAETAMAKAGDNDAGNRMVVAQYRKVLDFNASFARWGQTPGVPMMTHCLTTVKTVMVVMQKSLALYKEKAAA